MNVRKRKGWTLVRRKRKIYLHKMVGSKTLARL